MIGSVSLQLFGEKDILVESFEFLHTAFFQVAVAFFLAAGGLVVAGIQKSNQITTISTSLLSLQLRSCQG